MVKILWIDNDFERRDIAKRCGAEKGDFFYEPDKINPRLNHSQYDLIILDYKLHSKKYGHGYELGAIIRRNNRLVPIYILTQEDFTEAKNKDIAEFCEKNFEEVIMWNDLNCRRIKTDAEDFSLIKKRIPLNKKKITSLLNIPQKSQERFFKALPNEFSEENVAKSIHLFNFSKWIKKKLFRYPGPLINKEELTAHLGIKKTPFKRIKDDFKSAEYKGIFHRNREALWWKDEVDRIIFSHKEAQKMSTISIPHIIQKMYGMRKNQMEKCEKCGKLYPEIRALKKNTEKIYGTVHYSCSEIDEERSRMLFFDEPRTYSP